MSGSPIVDIAIYIVSGLIGLLVGWFLWGVYKSKYQELYKQSTNDKNTINNLIDEFQGFKSKSQEELEQVNKEMRKWKRLSETMSMTQTDKTSEKELKLLQEQVEALESKVQESKPLVQKTKELIKHNGKLKEELANAAVRIKKQDILLLKAKKEAFPKNDSKEIKKLKEAVKNLKGEIVDKQNQIDSFVSLEKSNKKLKKKIKKLKKLDQQSGKPRVEITQSLDIKKLVNLLEDGSLLVKKKKVIK